MPPVSCAHIKLAHVVNVKLAHVVKAQVFNNGSVATTRVIPAKNAVLLCLLPTDMKISLIGQNRSK